MSISKTNYTITLILAVLIGASIVFLLNKKLTTEEFSAMEGYTNKLGEIETQKAIQMVKGYIESLPTTMSRESKDSIVRSVHFDFGSLASYMLKMKLRRGATGMRMYFGKYVEKEEREVDGEKKKIDLKGYNTVVIVATKKEDGNIIDIITDESGKRLLNVIYQPYNGGISCPPYPARVCDGQRLINLANGDSSFLNK